LASIKKNLVFNFILSASQLLLPLVSIPYVSHVLDPQGIGKVSFIDSLTYYFISIAEFGIVVYGMREVARIRSDKAALAKLVSELLSLHVISSAITIFIYSSAVFLLWMRIHDERLLLFSFSFLLVNSFACEWYFYGTEQFRYITTRSVITRICGLAGIFLLVHQPTDYYLYYGIIAATGVVNILWNVATLIRQVKISLVGSNWKRHIPRTWVTYTISLLYSVSLMLDNVLLGLVASAAFVAFYAFAIKLVRLSSMALTDTLIVFFPRAVTLLHMEEKKKFQHAILRNIQLLNLFSLPIGVGLFFLSDEITAIVFGPQFHAVAFNLKILSLVPFLRCYNLFLSKQVLIAYDKEKLYVRSLLISGLIFVAATLLLSSLFRDRGASIAMLLYESCLVAFNYYYARKLDAKLKVFDWRSLRDAIAGALLFIPMIFLLRRWMQTDWLFLSVIIGACAVVYVLFEAFVIRNELMLSLRAWGSEYLLVQFQKRHKQ